MWISPKMYQQGFLSSFFLYFVFLVGGFKKYVLLYKPFIFLVPFFSPPSPFIFNICEQFYLHFWPKLLYIFLSVSVSPLSRMVPFGKIYSLVLSPSKFPIKPVTSPLNSSGTVAERVSWRVLTCIFSWIPEKINHCSHLKFQQYL